MAPRAPSNSAMRSRDTLPRGLEMSSRPIVLPDTSADLAWRAISARWRSLVGSSNTLIGSSLLRSPLDRHRHRTAPDRPTRPSTNDGREQARASACMRDQQAIGGELGQWITVQLFDDVLGYSFGDATCASGQLGAGNA